MKIEGEWDDYNWYGEVRVNGFVLDPRPSQSVKNHSPDGFAWGYAGSGPSQLALAILLKAGVHPDRALQLYQDFKREFLEHVPNNEALSIDVDIYNWIQSKS